DLLNKAIEEYLDGIQNLKLKETIGYSLLPGGKRLRPLLLFTLLSDLGEEPSKGLYPALAIEMIHTYSLIHDDLPAMDNDDFRRGKPSLHKKYNEALAILTGDALLSDAFRYFLKTPVETFKQVELIRIVSECIGSSGMVLGQVLDLAGDPKTIEAIHLHKTQDLFRLTLLSGGIIAGLTNLAELDNLSFYFGHAFQIKDDLDDYLTEPDKITHPLVYGSENSRAVLAEYREMALMIVQNMLGRKEMYKLIQRILG
ncbi:MAG: polyprenyl synthetase family protein, partial [Firmicutes bacterium]|nr:polyprenyl synthetase family protein [Bacillota bacterium]